VRYDALSKEGRYDLVLDLKSLPITGCYGGFPDSFWLVREEPKKRDSY